MRRPRRLLARKLGTRRAARNPVWSAPEETIKTRAWDAGSDAVANPDRSAAAGCARRDLAVQNPRPSDHRYLPRRFRRPALGPLCPAGSVGLRQIDAAEGGRWLHGADR